MWVQLLILAIIGLLYTDPNRKNNNITEKKAYNSITCLIIDSETKTKNKDFV